jgi:hypothetical protein
MLRPLNRAPHSVIGSSCIGASAHYQAPDPCNMFNPGIGRTAKRVRWD